MSRDNLPVPTESQEQTALFQWAQMQEEKYLELSLFYHIANGSSRQPLEAWNTKIPCVKNGVPDICQPVPLGDCHGCTLSSSGRRSPEQALWINTLTEQSNSAAIYAGWEVTAEFIKG